MKVGVRFLCSVAVIAMAWLLAARLCHAQAAPTSSPEQETGAHYHQDVRPQDPQIDAWIAALDSNRYLEREQATQSLIVAIKSGDATAIPPLLAAANGGRPEQEDRAVWVLRQVMDIPDLQLRQQVLEHLVQVKDRPQVVAEAQVALADIRHEFAVAAIEKLGGRYYDAVDRDPQWQQAMPRRIVFTNEWRGGDEGLKLCADLRDVPLVMVFGTNLTADGVAQLAGAGSIQQLKLYGTPITEAEAAQLQARMPGILIDYRKGAFLGVIGDDNLNAAIVRTVQPNTAAAAAGILPRDIIRKFNDRPVVNFKELTQEIAKHVPGDEVKLEIVRDGTPLEVKLKLGQWKAP